MPFNVRQEGIRNLESVQTTNRGLLERALQMRAASYLAQQKAMLLTHTIFEIDRSKEELRAHSRELEHDRSVIERQKAELEARTAALEAIQRTLEQRVQRRTQELEQSNLALREEVATRARIQAEREQLQEKFLQAQKLELVGLLTGGVAHDFNNLLTVILGNAELALAGLREAPQAESIGAIIDAAERGAELTRHLLAFARKRARSATVIRPAAVLEGFAPLLRRVIGERAKLELRIDPDLGGVAIGGSELEQLVLNLVVNARDAMPRGGAAAIWLREAVRPDAGPAPHGRCVELGMRDTGEGMTEEVVQHVFEPFFTTKPAGMGTGLGLSTVRDIVRDCGGEIEVETSVGVGTTFRVYLPLAGAESESRAAATKGPSALPRGDEAVLVVDDDESVRSVVRQMLLSLGYRVFTAGALPAALELLGRQGVDLAIVDSRLPARSDKEVLGELARYLPAERILLMSGGADAVPCRPGSYVEKPLVLASLASAVRKMLDEAPRGVRTAL